MTSRHVAERLRSDKLRGFDEDEVEASACESPVAVTVESSCFMISRMNGSGLRMFLKGSSDSSSDDGSGRRRFCFCFLSAISGNDEECANCT